jgi:hypothetical protein
MEKDPLITLKDFEGRADVGAIITISPGIEITIAEEIKSIEGLGEGKAYQKVRHSVFFKDQECFLIPADQFGIILAHAKVTLEEKGSTDGKEERKEPTPGDTKIN